MDSKKVEEKASEKKLKCTFCGTAISMNDDVCPRCGADFTTERLYGANVQPGRSGILIYNTYPV